MAYKAAVIVAYVFMVFLWSMTVWGPWAALIYEKTKQNDIIWFWLAVFKVPRTKENCVRFLKAVSFLGIALVTLWVNFILTLPASK